VQMSFPPRKRLHTFDSMSYLCLLKDKPKGYKSFPESAGILIQSLIYEFSWEFHSSNGAIIMIVALYCFYD